MTRTYRGALLLALVIPLLLPASAWGARRPHVVKGLDYLYTRQRASGGFSYASVNSSPFDTPWAVLAIAAGGNGPQRWRHDGRNPVGYLQSIDLTAAAAQSDNVPKYYSLCILAYYAAGRTDLLSSAGATQIDLVAKLESYATLTGGYFSPVVNSTTKATETTAWATLALHAAKESGAIVDNAVSWLSTTGDGVNADGGFGIEPAAESRTSYTGLALQALHAGGVGPSDGVVTGAVDFLRGMQRSSGGFADTDKGYVSTPVTAWAIEGLRAAGQKPATWVKTSGGQRNSPYGYLIDRQRLNGSFYEYAGDIGDVMGSTTQATIALTGKHLGIPIGLSRNVVDHYVPWFLHGSVKPVNKQKFTTSLVTVQASYRDNDHGTGIKTSAIRVAVDGIGKTKAATISASHLTLKLAKLTNSSHTVVITIADHAGNTAHTTRTFTVAVPPKGGTSPPTGGNTHPGSGTGGGTVVVPTHTPTARPSSSSTTSTQTTPPTANIPGTTLTPTPTPSFPATPAPSPSTSVNGQIAATTNSGGGGGSNSPAIVATVVAVLAAAAFGGMWLVRRHLLGTLSGASRGYVLQEGSSAWQRFWKPSGTPPADRQE